MSAGNLIEQAISAEGLSGSDAAVARSIYAQESGSGKNTQTSNRGARGGMQIIPATFNSVADKDWSIDDPLHNARAGVRYIKQLSKLADGDPGLIAAGYYGGPGGLAKAKKGVGVSDPVNPKNPNTLQYRDQVLARMGGDVGPRGGRVAATPPALPAGSAARSAPVEVAASAPEQAPAYTPIPAVGDPGPGYGGGGAIPSGPNAWQSFLAAMPQSKVQPVQVADYRMNYGSMSPLQAPPAVIAAKPHIEAFKGWKAKLA